MAAIEVTPIGSAEFEVQVVEEDGRSTHRVTVPPGYADELGAGDVPLQRLVRESFRFLLEREPRESILSSFELSVITRYFPEYPDEIADRLR